jgi:DNA primase
MLPRTFPDEVRQQTDIVRIVSDYVSLKKRGQNWIACCPFHSEKTPSFNVHPGKGIYKCFGCSAGGNVFDFVMRIEGLSFPDAVRLVAERAGIPIPKEVAPSADAQKAERWRKRLFELNEWACEWFESQLGAGAEGQRALEYLESRGITSTTRERLRLGYAPSSWDALSTHLASRGATRQEIADSGLVTVKESGSGYYDRFRGRVMFPIADAQGKPVAFGGRTMGGDDGGPKYLNSPETAVYTKGNHLYGVAFAKEAIRKAGFAILVEGYLDVVIPFQEGVENVVASLGTALTEAQARLLRRYMSKPQVIVNYDPDTAGQAATARSFEILLAQGFKINVLTLPGGLDPDEFVREQGAAAYRELLRTSMPYLDYVVDQAMTKHDLTRPSGKADALNEVLPFIAQIENQLERVEYARRAGERMRIDEEILRKELRRAASRREPKIARERVAATAAMTDLERHFLVVLFEDAGVRSSILPGIEEADIEGLASEPIFRALLEAHRSGEAVGYAEISEQLSEQSRQDLTSLVSLDIDQVLSDYRGATREERIASAVGRCHEKLRQLSRERELERLQKEIRTAEATGDYETSGRMQLRVRDLKMKLLQHSRHSHGE